MNKKLAGVIIAGMVISILAGCSSTEEVQETGTAEETEAAETEEKEESEDNESVAAEESIVEDDSNSTGKYALGETAGLEVLSGENVGATIDVTLTEWGTVYQDFVGVLTYVNYEIKNTGSIDVTVGNGIFNVYADNYNIEQYTAMDDVVFGTKISGGRQVSGTIYVELNPDTVSNIEVECGHVVWVIKEPTAVIEDSAIPADILRDTDAIPYENVAGEYDSIGGLYVAMSMYSSIEDEYIGNITIQGNGEVTGQLVKVATNVYQVTTTDGSVVLLGLYMDNENACLDLYIDGQHIDYFVMTSPFVS